MKPWEGNVVRIRQTWTRAVLVGATLALACACTVTGGSADSSYPGFRPVGVPSPEAVGASGVEPLTIRDTDVAGHTVTALPAGESPRVKDVRTDPGCGPVALALTGVAAGHPASSTVRRATATATVTTVALASYKGSGDAERVMTDINQAADTCAGGFAVTVRGREQHILKVVRELAPSGTDQAIAFGMTTERNGTKAPAEVVVVRKGSTVCVFSTVGKGAAPSRDAFGVPVEVIEAQLLRLG